MFAQPPPGGGSDPGGGLSVRGRGAVLDRSERGPRRCRRHQGPLMGVPGTGHTITLPGVNIFRIQNGKIVERCGWLDELGPLRELGISPDPTADGAAASTSKASTSAVP